jgi:hypothetical protein
MEAQYGEMIKIEPAVLKQPKPFLDHAFNGRAQVQLGAKGVEHYT